MDATTLTIDILTAALPGVQVSSEVPTTGAVMDRPSGPYVCVWRDSGETTFLLDRPNMALVCWGSSDAAAYALSMDCVRALKDASMSDPVLSAAEVISVSRDEWAGDGASRYRVDITLTINL